MLAAAFLVPSLWPSDSGESLTYTEWRTQVDEGNIATAVINTGSGKITGEFVNGDKLHAPPVAATAACPTPTSS